MDLLRTCCTTSPQKSTTNLQQIHDKSKAYKLHNKSATNPQQIHNKSALLSCNLTSTLCRDLKTELFTCRDAVTSLHVEMLWICCGFVVQQAVQQIYNISTCRDVVDLLWICCRVAANHDVPFNHVGKLRHNLRHHFCVYNSDQNCTSEPFIQKRITTSQWC